MDLSWDIFFKVSVSISHRQFLIKNDADITNTWLKLHYRWSEVGSSEYLFCPAVAEFLARWIAFCQRLISIDWRTSKHQCRICTQPPSHNLVDLVSSAVEVELTIIGITMNFDSMSSSQARISVVYRRNKRGPMMEPCGTLELTFVTSGDEPFISTRCVLLFRIVSTQQLFINIRPYSTVPLNNLNRTCAANMKNWSANRSN